MGLVGTEDDRGSHHIHKRHETRAPAQLPLPAALQYVKIAISNHGKRMKLTLEKTDISLVIDKLLGKI